MKLIALTLGIYALAAAQAPAAADRVDAEQSTLRQLLQVRRVFVDRLSGGETAGQIRDMIISSLQNSKLFLITENQDRADAILRGSAEDLVYNEVHNSSESINARADAGSGRNSKTTTGRYAGASVGQNESMHSSERRHEATAAVRLVNKDGDVIWSTTQESLGAKFRGSSADVADKVTRKLIEDYQRARKLAP